MLNALWFRLTIVLIFVIGFTATWAVYFELGQAEFFSAINRQFCMDYWYINLLYANNMWNEGSGGTTQVKKV